MARRLRVLFLAAEATPFMKVGGLGDVVGALPRALVQMPERPEVRVALPLHGGIDQTKYGLKILLEFPLEFPEGGMQTVRVYETDWLGLPYYFLAGDPVEVDSQVYSSQAADDVRKFAFVSRAALALCGELAWKPDVLHAHDWHMALAVHWLHNQRRNWPLLRSTRSILTIHNLPYQGQGAEATLLELGETPAMAPGIPPWASLNPMALGLQAADRITTVSPGYAVEIQTPEFGAGLEGLVRERSKDLSGILNGIDVELWNPAKDPLIAENYSNDEFADRRAANKAWLQRKLGWAEDGALPLLAMVGRMDSQKGVELAIAALRRVLDEPWQVVFLGTGDSAIEKVVAEFSQEFPERVAAKLQYEERWAHWIFAAADAILIPSHYEPCGLTQMIAMRYGCVPVARSVGGLGDTIRSGVDEPDSTGFLIGEPTAEAFGHGIRTALAAFRDTIRWEILQRNGMLQDFSWDLSARAYLALYTDLAGLAQGNR